ncbi:N-(5'-phosphoribosyl)anthranilate isomerase [Clostridia bacterium]|nr:N-(5'-phosphoribosyl)anthranilate isomerase [Clostridia bacterium]
MSKLKICGLRRPEDMEYANICRPDYIGFVFAESKRRVSPEQAAELKAKLDSGIKAVGVFVDEEIGVIQRLCENGTIDLVQLHGDEDGGYIERLKSKIRQPVIKAVAVGGGPIDTAYPADYLLFDAYSRSARGGSGETFDWNRLGAVKRPYFLAGGLNAENVGEAVRRLVPYCVDISSGAETDGKKDLEKMRKITEKLRGV